MSITQKVGRKPKCKFGSPFLKNNVTRQQNGLFKMRLTSPQNAFIQKQKHLENLHNPYLKYKMLVKVLVSFSFLLFQQFENWRNIGWNFICIKNFKFLKDLLCLTHKIIIQVPSSPLIVKKLIASFSHWTFTQVNMICSTCYDMICYVSNIWPESHFDVAHHVP